jgi:6-pyruvoyltetrahydropterin/6-carboxytetrahydropterin synthase
MNICVYKEFTIDAAHALDGYSGKCKNIHGHTYHLKIGIVGKPSTDSSSSSFGMVMDFKDLKELVKTEIESRFDHHLILKDDSRFLNSVEGQTAIRLVDYQPTCENMLIEIVSILKEKLPKHVKLYNVLLRETATSYAEWREDM